METPLNIADLFFDQAKLSPEQIAIVDGNQTVRFADLEKKVAAYIRYLQRKGVEKGDRVLVFVPMGIPLYTAVLAILKLGAVAVFLDQWSGFKRLNTCCEIANCKAFLSGWKGRLIGLLSKEIRKIPIKLSVEPRVKEDSDKAISDTTSSDAALITFTTGSTGLPKAAFRTHGFLTAQFEVLSKEVDPNLSKIDMPVLPIVLLINLGKGVTSVIADFASLKAQDLKPHKILQQLRQQQVTSITGSPYFISELSRFLLANPSQSNGLLVKRIFTGGAAVFPQEAALFQAAFSGASINILYGSTEAEPISSVTATELIQHDVAIEEGLYVGKINESAQVKIIPIIEEDLAFQTANELSEFALAAGEVGEIIVSGPHVLKQYYNNEEALKRNKIFINGECWHRTGDSGFVKEDTLYLTGPCQQMIWHKEQWISIFVYEHLLKSILGVELATILLIKDEIVAVIQAKGDDKKTVSSKISESTEFKEIQKIAFLEKIPKDPRHHSKIEYKKIEHLISVKNLIDVSKS